MNGIGFWGRKQGYFFLANFYQASFVVDGKTWKTSEHFYQAQKVLTGEDKERIRDEMTAKGAALLGRSLPIRPDWDDVKEDAMRRAIYEKFTQNKDIKQALLDTGDNYLYEASPFDSYWCIGSDGKGKSRLGELLM